MDKKKAKKPTAMDIFVVLFYFPLQNKYSTWTSTNNSRICKVHTKHVRVKKNQKTGQKVCSTL